ncbi:MAG: META domain-containing protein [Dehalococcoidales bacterium]|nr:META domain-containing protein [Dehalococcoidales bacterium]
MRNMFVAVTLSVFIVTGLAACGAPGSDSMLEDTKWFLRSYGEQGSLEAIIEGTEITATFHSAKGEVSGSAGCNTYFARYEIDGSKLSILEMAFTEMACVSPEGVMEQEQVFLSILTGARSFQADDTTLTIFCSGAHQLYFTTAIRS